MLLNKVSNRRVDEVIDDRGHSKNATQNSNDINKKTVPRMIANDVQHCHRVCLISTFKITYLK